MSTDDGRNQDAMSTDEYVRSLPRYHRRPEEVFPEWALQQYRVLHSELAARRPEAIPPE